MLKTIRFIALAIFITALVATVLAAKNLIDERQLPVITQIRNLAQNSSMTQVSGITAITKSPQFSAEEIAREIPDGVHWILTDKDGYEFDWDAFCSEHPNCLEGFRLKGIPFPQNHSSAWGPEDEAAYYNRLAEDMWNDEQERLGEDHDLENFEHVGCSTDMECTAKYGGGEPDFRR